ncbi:MAG: Ppx/GppA family phosphatase [Deltaproteobacteria bacterium]|nr:Ppx/GppA family phosphatase [Deltaproteobacteria bacterium]
MVIKSTLHHKASRAVHEASTKRFAAIDIGTNTILMLIAELEGNGAFRVLDDQAEIARLGEGVDRTRRIGSGGEERSVGVLKSYLKRCRGLGVDEIVAVGTSALRDADNAGDFKARLRQELGLDLRVLSGEEEAAYSYLAVQRGLPLEGKEVLVVDVGGGSTELVWGEGGVVRRTVSLDLGSVRLTERFLISDPVREEECAELSKTIDREIEQLRVHWQIGHSLYTMVGIAGTFTTLTAIEKGLRQYSHSEVHGSRLSRDEVQRQLRLFKGKTLSQRKEIAGLEPKRADVILAGALLIDRIMAFFLVDQATVSDQGIRYGLLHERLSAFG